MGGIRRRRRRRPPSVAFLFFFSRFFWCLASFVSSRRERCRVTLNFSLCHSSVPQSSPFFFSSRMCSFILSRVSFFSTFNLKEREIPELYDRRSAGNMARAAIPVVFTRRTEQPARLMFHKEFAFAHACNKHGLLLYEERGRGLAVSSRSGWWNLFPRSSRLQRAITIKPK